MERIDYNIRPRVLTTVFHNFFLILNMFSIIYDVYVIDLQATCSF